MDNRYLFIQGTECFESVASVDDRDTMGEAYAALIEYGVDDNDIYVKPYATLTDESEHFQFYIRAGVCKPIHTSIVNKAAGRGCLNTRKDDT